MKPSFAEALKFWIKLGFISFGGPVGQIAIMYDHLVVKKKWLTEEKFSTALNYCMLLPGPEAQQLATYSGWILHGLRGGIAAGFFFIFPSMLILMGLSIVYVKYGAFPLAVDIFGLLKATVLAIIIYSLTKMAKKSSIGLVNILISVSCFLAMYFFQISFIYLILLALGLGIGKNIFKKDLAKKNEESSFFNRASFYGFVKKSSKQLAVFTSIGVTFYFFLGYFSSFWSTIVLFFTKAAFVTFGGAYAVLPYVAQQAVYHYQWLSTSEMMDGLALGETTPGPLVMVLVFVGFMAGYHHFGGSILLACMTLIITMVYTFLPSFCFVLVGAPIIEKSDSNSLLSSGLKYVTPVVVGAMLYLFFILAKNVVLADTGNLDYVKVCWAICGLCAFYFYKVKMEYWILTTLAVGVFVHYFIK